MKLPISKRLLACAACVHPGDRIADVGTDHGYLGIYLLKKEVAKEVIALDLRRKPLEHAVENAEFYGVKEKMQFRCCDGLAAVGPEEIDAVVCAGMGSDLIIHILEEAPWLRHPSFRLILQPQSSGQDLRRWLCENGFAILRESLTEDGGFLYTVLEASFDGMERRLTPGQQFVSPQLLLDRSPYFDRYLAKLIASMEKTVAGIEKGTNRKKLNYYSVALSELREMGKEYGDRT